MKANQLATLALRLLGIFLIALSSIGIWQFGTAIEQIINREDNLDAKLKLLCLAAPIVVGTLLIACAGPLGEKMTPKSTGTEGVSAITFRQIQTLAFAIAGLVIFAGALPEVLTSIFYIFRSYSENSPEFFQGMSQMMIESSIGTLLRAALGIWLFFGASGFADFFSPTKYFATSKPPQE